MQRLRCAIFLSLAVCALLASYAWTQEPTSPAATASPAASPAAKPNGGKQKYSHANDFVIRGSVFTDKALAFPGVRLRIRRAEEKKFRWDDHTNSRGEFAIRVPQGFQYEMLVQAKGFADQTKTVDAKSGADANNNFVFRMQPARGKK